LAAAERLLVIDPARVASSPALTSLHVDGITVAFADGRDLPAKLVGSDARGDAAVIDLRERHARGHSDRRFNCANAPTFRAGFACRGNPHLHKM
jgi:S1-C subfamily serine protease